MWIEAQNTVAFNGNTFNHKFKGGVYCLVCYATGDMYIGSTWNLRKRYCEHQSDIKTKPSALYRIIRALGPENFKFEVLEHIPGGNVDEYVEVEKLFISILKPSLNCNMVGYQKELDPVSYEQAETDAMKRFRDYRKSKLRKRLYGS